MASRRHWCASAVGVHCGLFPLTVSTILRQMLDHPGDGLLVHVPCWGCRVPSEACWTDNIPVILYWASLGQLMLCLPELKVVEWV